MSCVTDDGFVRPSYDELLSRQIARAKTLFGENIDTSGNSSVGKFIRIDVKDLDECYETLEDIYYSVFPHSARGDNLDRLCPFVAVTRSPASGAKIKVEFTGTAGSTVPAAFLVTDGNVEFYVLDDVDIGAGGTVEAEAKCVTDGIIGNITSDSSLSIVNPSADILSVRFVELTELGTERETDYSLRNRFDQSATGAGSATVSAIKGAIYRVNLVDGVSVIENDTDEAAGSIPAHGFACYVLAPESQDQLIAEAIFSKKPPGITCAGDVSCTVYDDWKQPHEIKFFRAVKVAVKLKVTIKTNRFFESNGKEQIRDNLLDYINNLATNDSVYYTSLFGYIHSVSGVVTVTSLTLGKSSGSYGTSDIAIGEYEIARITSDAIEIVVVS